VNQGEFLGLVGRTGAGKSTLLYAMCGLIPFQKNGSISGNVYVDGHSMEEYSSLGELISKVSMVLEDPDNQLFNLYVEDEIMWGAENFGMEEEEILDRMEYIMDLLDLTELKDRITYNLSGGEKQKVAIASIYALNPEVILLDEPTSELDPVGTELVFSVVSKLVDEGVTVVMAEHKIEEIAEFADRIALIKDGRISTIDKTRDFLLNEELYDEVSPPQVTELGKRLANNEQFEGTVPITLDEATDEYSPIFGDL